MRFDTVIKLLSVEIVQDELLNEIERDVERKVYANEMAVGMEEFYTASVQDIKPELQFQVHAFEYKGESKLEYNDETYRIIRAPKRGEWVRIICEKVIGDG